MEQPTSDYFGAQLKKDVESGAVSSARLDDMLHRQLRSEFAAGLFDRADDRKSPDIFRGLAAAQHVAEEGSVLLKNAAGQLPLAASVRSIAAIGSHADVAVLSGGGSAQVDPPGGNVVQPEPGVPQLAFGDIVWMPSSPMKAIRAKAPRARIDYDSGKDPAAAARLAKAADVAIVFVHQPSSEGGDIASLSLPYNQDALVDAVATANAHTIVVLETGAAVLMPWVDKVSAVLETWFPGIRGGEAIANILFGDVNPSARLPITFPRSEADLPHPKLAEQPPAGEGEMVPFIPGTDFKMNTHKFDIAYDEGLKVGYKWYESEGKSPLFAFGHGLTYTTFTYSDLKVTSTGVTFNVRNTGPRAGVETAQVYATLPASAGEPFHRLVAWQKVSLRPGEVKAVSLALDAHYLSIFNADLEEWELPTGSHTISVGASSKDLPLHGSFNH